MIVIHICGIVWSFDVLCGHIELNQNNQVTRDSSGDLNTINRYYSIASQCVVCSAYRIKSGHVHVKEAASIEFNFMVQQFEG